MTSRRNAARGGPPPNHWLVLAIGLSLAKLILFILDSNPQVFLGDSMSYLVTARLKWIPPDRSFVYGFLVDYLTARSRSLSSLVAFQTFAGIATSMLTAAVLVRFFRLSFTVAAVAAIAITLEPQQLLYERFVMTESVSTAIFALFLLLSFEYLRTSKLWTLAAMQIAGLLLVSFRVSFVPMLATATLVGPMLATNIWTPAIANQWKRTLPRIGIHLVVSIGLFLGLHSLYKTWNGSLSKLPPAYTYADGFFLITNVSPLVTAADTDDPELASVLATPVVYATKPEEFNSRNSEMFDENGLVARLRHVLKEPYRTNIEAKRIAYRVIRRDPIGFARLAIQTHLKFYSRDYMSEILRGEAGMRELGPDEFEILSHYHLDARGLPFMKTITREYYIGVWPFYILLANTPLVLAAAFLMTRRYGGRFMAFLLITTSVHVVVVQVLGVEPSPRHLHAATVSLILGLGMIASVLSSRTSGLKSDR